MGGYTRPISIQELVKHVHIDRQEILKNKQANTVALDCKRTIPTERLPHVSEVSANFCG
jgi:hypothetical protein